MSPPSIPLLTPPLPVAFVRSDNKLMNQIGSFHRSKQVRIATSLYFQNPLSFHLNISPALLHLPISQTETTDPPGRQYWLPSSCRSHFIFDKEKGQLVDIAIKVKPADEYVHFHLLLSIIFYPSLLEFGCSAKPNFFSWTSGPLTLSCVHTRCAPYWICCWSTVPRIVWHSSRTSTLNLWEGGGS
jgi:hypothetical protein